MSFDRRRILIMLGSGAAATFAPGVSLLNAQEKKIRIAFANYNDEASFGALVLKGIQEAAKAHLSRVVAAGYDDAYVRNVR